ncbi:hypothetical protein LSAT2_018846 [Lamellibrachia satsuma]|nr:hypothetical protein LSAT2_018846 [Lamellibrachia satsuma]
MIRPRVPKARMLPFPGCAAIETRERTKPELISVNGPEPLSEGRAGGREGTFLCPKSGPCLPLPLFNYVFSRRFPQTAAARRNPQCRKIAGVMAAEQATVSAAFQRRSSSAK